MPDELVFDTIPDCIDAVHAIQKFVKRYGRLPEAMTALLNGEDYADTLIELGDQLKKEGK